MGLGRAYSTSPRPVCVPHQRAVPRIAVPIKSQPQQQHIQHADVSSASLWTFRASTQDATTSIDDSTGQRDLQKLIAMVPFRKLAIWGIVAFASYQLHEFMGVGL